MLLAEVAVLLNVGELTVRVFPPAEIFFAIEIVLELPVSSVRSLPRLIVSL